MDRIKKCLNFKHRMSKKGMVDIGTSGIVVQGNKNSFPAAYQNTGRFHYYCTLFNSLKINSSFTKFRNQKLYKNDRWMLPAIYSLL